MVNAVSYVLTSTYPLLYCKLSFTFAIYSLVPFVCAYLLVHLKLITATHHFLRRFIRRPVHRSP
jgi:hypothetical protein